MASISQRPLSPSLSDTTTRASEFDFCGKVITRADLRTSVQSYEQVHICSWTHLICQATETCYQSYYQVSYHTLLALNFLKFLISLFAASQAYSAALLSLSLATATFADAIHACAK